jgi:thiol-disulfide isomerase/thioredoxin
MKTFLLAFLAILLSSCMSKTLDPISNQVDLRDAGPAPELTNQVWLNTPAPIHLADLRGKVVLLEMWTFECVNCQHTIPTLNDWYKNYSAQGLVIIGNHYPEFPEEASLQNLKNAVQKAGIQYPVAQDNDGVTWRAYESQYWPSMYLIDKKGEIRYVSIGEGGYDLTETAIQTLLTETYP